MRACAAAAILLSALAGCAGPRRHVDANAEAIQAEALAGQSAVASLEERYGGVVRDAAAELRMQRLADRLVAATPVLVRPYELRLLAADEINAVSLPAGHIYITRALYARLDDDMLAATIAHEMAHLLARDSFRPACTSAQDSLERECSADARAAAFLVAASFPAGALDDLLVGIADALPDGWCEQRRAALIHAGPSIESP